MSTNAWCNVLNCLIERLDELSISISSGSRDQAADEVQALRLEVIKLKSKA